MNGILPEGHVLQAESGEKITVGRMFGAGGQGEVYLAQTPGGERAVKWYYPAQATDLQRRILDSLIGLGWSDDRFLWPQSVVVDPQRLSSGFGYVMALRPDRFKDLPALFRRDPSVSAVNQRTLLIAALHTVEAYQALHARGIAYRDINWGNIFFDPATGEILVCDNDNAVFESEAAAIAGTMDFMAPELVRGHPGAAPGTQTDLHSLAVLLFMLFMNHHPFQGALALKIRCLDEAAQRKLYGTRPVFVFDPDDTTNRPVPGEQDTVLATWRTMPPVLRKLFVQTFTRGLTDPAERVRESQWRIALSSVLDSVLRCSTCDKINLGEPGGPAPECWKCARPLALPQRLELLTGVGSVRGRREVRLIRDGRIYGYHLVSDPLRHDFDDVVGVVTEHPNKRGVFGLTNRSRTAWSTRRPDGTSQPVPPGRTAALRQGITIEFGGGTEGVVHI
ncbi:serine/threonine protein kinase [Actinacidiphila acididurans]|uniref:Serine/threonine protein kinase n=1 Tax=Actinacidiphila acididurans TaxID=2784346 RepID=A0ABS2U4Y0_9ACTN|nr:serine/threonine-protein kinase [Actinacidiphila acididurans]MBM9510675.1 serine/threonine protein kinase [Actinacidiphila acididurans]